MFRKVKIGIFIEIVPNEGWKASCKMKLLQLKKTNLYFTQTTYNKNTTTTTTTNIFL